MITKICTRCKTDKPIEDFINRKGSRHHKGSWCKKCARDHAVVKGIEYRKTNAEAIKARKKIYRENNLEQIRERDKIWQKENAEEIRIRNRARERKRKDDPHYRWVRYNAKCKRDYGITGEQVEQLLIIQKGVCLCCGKDLPIIDGRMSSLMCVDHCHNTGMVRGLICHYCNVIIGQVEIIGLDKISRYIEHEKGEMWQL